MIHRPARAIAPSRGVSSAAHSLCRPSTHSHASSPRSIPFKSFSSTEPWQQRSRRQHSSSQRACRSVVAVLCQSLSAHSCLPRPGVQSIQTHLPLGELELGLATTLGDDALVLLQAAANGTGRDGQVAVVAIRGKYVSLVRSTSRRGSRCAARCSVMRGQFDGRT